MCSFCTRLIDSSPPATMIGTLSTITRCAAIAIACRPDEQKRLTVVPAVVTGSPARSAAWRAMFWPVAPSGSAQPITTSSTSPGSIPARFTAWAMTWPPMAAPCVLLNAPRYARPIGVRAVETMTASAMSLLLVLVGRREHYTGRHGGPLLRGARRGRRAGGRALRARRAVLRRRLPRLAHDQLRRRRVGDARLPLRDVRAPRAGTGPARRAGRRLRGHGRPRRGLQPRGPAPPRRPAADLGDHGHPRARRARARRGRARLRRRAGGDPAARAREPDRDRRPADRPRQARPPRRP